ncbi:MULTISPECIES: alcohol dehydrogenase catalytic domain-containing protein [Glutamicibacter]|uniref:alcohol dehydrogenase catalytic domain-containing protein n=1 Tax=Glutamicibacter TaxID=1742989 RepID=UPI0021556C18|nr:MULTISPECIES: alcohol dehydrogenase catalytic domain-containing protein [Glutamicibacter]
MLIRVAAAGLNRTDVIQRGGRANLPEGASDILGLEVSGTIAQLGSDVSGISVGDEVVALTDSGGYAEYVAVPAGQVAPRATGLGSFGCGRDSGSSGHRGAQCDAQRALPRR